MDYKVVTQPRAESDVAEAYAYIFERAPESAGRWIAKLKAEIASLSSMPGRCAKAPESSKLGFELRQSLVGKRSGVYRVIFRILESEREVHVLAVRHGARKPIEPEDLEL